MLEWLIFVYFFGKNFKRGEGFWVVG